MNEMQIPSKTSAAESASPASSRLAPSAPVVPSPAVAPVHHEPPATHAHHLQPQPPQPPQPLHATHHHHVIQSTSSIQPPSTHIEHAEAGAIAHQHALSPAKSGLLQSLTTSEYGLDQYEQQLYGVQYGAHPALHDHQHGGSGGSGDFSDMNYYKPHYGWMDGYDEHNRPYSASSNSCSSSSNSEGDSQMGGHHSMHPPYANAGNGAAPHNNNNHSHRNHSHSRQHGHHATSVAATIVSDTVSPTSYDSCLSRQSFEVSCFEGITSMEMAHPLHEPAHYMSDYSKSQISVSDLQHLTHLATNVSANRSGGNGALLGGTELSAAAAVTSNIDSIQYASVIVEPTNYHLTNQFVH